MSEKNNKPRNKISSIILLTIATPLCCLGNVITSFLPVVMDKAETSDMTYYLTGELEIIDIHAFHRLYKCNASSFLCEKTPFQAGGGASFQNLHLMIDKTTNPNEINIIWTSYDGKATLLEYTYGAQPRYYDYPAQLNNHLYYLAYHNKPSHKSAIFLLYECKLDNTSCKQLPIMYEGFGHLRDTVANETTGEINVYIDNQMGQNTLIFKWGKNPQCFVEGCEILEEIK